jgi:hypothetical protein
MTTETKLIPTEQRSAYYRVLNLRGYLLEPLFKLLFSQGLQVKMRGGGGEDIQAIFLYHFIPHREASMRARVTAVPMSITASQ